MAGADGKILCVYLSGEMYLGCPADLHILWFGFLDEQWRYFVITSGSMILELEFI